MNRLSQIEQGLKKPSLPSLKVGDTVRVYSRISEGEKERIQMFEGTLIARKGGGPRETVTVRKISFGVGVERVFPLHSPTLQKIDVLREGRVRRAKLYYLRSKRGRAARLEEVRSTSGAVGTDSGISEEAAEKEPVQAEKT